MANINETDLYNTDNKLILQPLWDLRLGYEDYLKSPLFPVFLSVGFYFALCIPFTIADVFCKNMDWYQKYKIQPRKEVVAPLLFDTLTLTFWNHLFFIMPTAVAQWIWTPATPLPANAPTLFEFIWQQIACLLVFDFQYFVWHWTHHKIRFLYRHIHGVHHRYSAPFVWTTQYLHPWELTTVGLLTTTNTWFFNCHCLTTWSYMIVSILVSVEGHIGFDFPILLNHWIPYGFYGGSPKHDMHHQKPLTNYQPFFNHLDKIIGTYCPPMSAGGQKSKALQDYEKRYRETKKRG